MLVAAEMGHEPELDLGVVGGHYDSVRSRRYEGFPDLLSPLRADRNVLQVRVGGAESSRRRQRLVEGRMDPSRNRGDVGRKWLYVCGEQLLYGSEFKYLVNYRVPVGDGSKRRFVGAIATAGRFLHLRVEFQLFEEHDAYLLRGRNVQPRLVGQFPDLGFEGIHFDFEFIGKRPELSEVYLHAGPFHAGEHGCERGFHILIKGSYAGFVHACADHFSEFQHCRGFEIPVRSVCRAFFRDVKQGNRSLFYGCGFFDIDAEIALGEDFDLVALLRIDEVMHRFLIRSTENSAVLISTVSGLVTPPLR